MNHPLGIGVREKQLLAWLEGLLDLRRFLSRRPWRLRFGGNESVFRSTMPRRSFGLKICQPFKSPERNDPRSRGLFQPASEDGPFVKGWEVRAAWES